MALRGLVLALLQLSAAFRPAFHPPQRRIALSATGSAAVADVSDGFLTPQQIKTLRREIDNRRRRRTLPWGQLAAGEGVDDAPFSDAIVAAATTGCETTEFFEVSGPSDQDAKRWPEIAFAPASLRPQLSSREMLAGKHRHRRAR